MALQVRVDYKIGPVTIPIVRTTDRRVVRATMRALREIYGGLSDRLFRYPAPIRRLAEFADWLVFGLAEDAAEEGENADY